jgi:hypothetical protein
MLHQNTFLNKTIPQHPVNQLYVAPNQVNTQAMGINYNAVVVPPEVRPFVQEIAFKIVQYLANRLDANKPATVLQWNEVSVNNFQTQEIVDLISMVGIWSAFGMKKNFYTNLAAAVEDAIPYIVDGRASYTICMMPQLLQQYTVEQQNVLAQKSSEYQQASLNMVNFINQYFGAQPQMNMQQMNPMMQMQQGIMQPNMLQQGGFNQGLMNNLPQNIMQQMQQSNQPLQVKPQTRPLQVGGGSMAPSTPFYQGNPGARVEMDNTLPDHLKQDSESTVDIEGILRLLPEEDRERYLKEQGIKPKTPITPAPPPPATYVAAPPAPSPYPDDARYAQELVSRNNIPPVMETETTAAPTIPPVMETVKTEALVWIPSLDQPYPPAANPKVNKRVLVNTDKGPRYKLVPKTEEELEMDRKAHQLNTPLEALEARTPFKVDGKPVANREDLLRVSVEKVAQSHCKAKEGESENNHPDKLNYHVGGYSSIKDKVRSMEEALSEAKIYKLLTTTDEELAAYRMDFVMEENFVIRGEHYSVFEDLLEVKKLETLALKIKLALKSEYPSSLVRAIVQLDSYVNKVLHDYITKELGLSNIEPTRNFCDYYEDLLGQVKQSGKLYYDTLMENEKTLFKRFFTLSTVPELIAEAGETEFNDTVLGAKLQCNSAMVLVDFFYDELLLDLEPGAGNRITESASDLIYGFLDQTTATSEYDANKEYGHIYLVSLDNRVLEIHRSPLDKESILVSVVK